MNKKGFTLIELLAVIIILGILMLIAIPSVSNYINNSKKSTYVTTINQLIKGVEMKVNSNKLKLMDEDTTYYIPCTCVDTESGEAKSPYGKFDPAYVVVTFDGKKYNYYFTGRDIQNMGVPTLTKSSNISKESITTNIKTIDTSIGIDGKNNIILFNDDCTEIIGENVASSTIGDNNNENIDNNESDSVVCPSKYTETIYWALKDVNSDGLNDKLIISDHFVDGDYKGSFSGNNNNSDITLADIPWGVIPESVNGNSYSINASSHLSVFVSDVIIEGVVAPVSLKYWFAYVGSSANKVNIDVTNLKTCHVTNMSNTFLGAGLYSESFSIIGLDDWDTSKVKTFYQFLADSGSRASTWDIGDLSNWNTSSATILQYMFLNAGQNVKNWSIGDIGNWDVSNVSIMDSMFNNAGTNSTSWSIGNINSWDTSKVTDMSYMFYKSGSNSNSFILDLSRWNTSKVTSFFNMFNEAGKNSSVWTIGDISNWDVSNSESFSYMFSFTGKNSESWSIGDINKWNIKKAIRLSYMFYESGYNAYSFELDLSNWNTSKVINMDAMFCSTGYNSTIFNLNISGWDFSRVSSMSSMFWNTGNKSSTFLLTIPKDNNGGLDNNSSKIYGNSEYIFTNSPPGKQFTIST